MQLTLEASHEIVDIDGARARTWTGTTGEGLPVRVYVLRIEPLGGTDAQRQALATSLIRSAHPPTVQPILPGPARPGTPEPPPSRPRSGDAA